MQYKNFSNIRYDDLSRINEIKRINWGWYEHNGVYYNAYIIKFSYQDGTNKFIRVFCEPGISEMIGDDFRKKEFFINRLFGENGLIVKEGRNDYIYLGGLSDDGRRITRFKKSINGKPMQDEFDKFFNEVIKPYLTIENSQFDYNPIDMVYHFHSGNEDMNDIFNNGLFSKYGTSFTSTFYPTHSNMYTIINNLEGAARRYGEFTLGKGHKVFVTRIPIMYRGARKENGYHHPPMPTLKVLDSQNRECIIIPEIIYGMYDIDNAKFYKNPNYKPKYNPNGLTYDDEVIKAFDMSDAAEASDMVNFMRSRESYNYVQLKPYDDQNGTFDKYCQYYGFSYNLSKRSNNDRKNIGSNNSGRKRK